MSHAIRAHAAERPEAEAVVEDGRTLTRGEFDRSADRLAWVLARAGVRPSDRVAWMMHNRAEVIVLAVAAQRLGAVVVPLGYRLSPPELRRLLAVVRPVLVVAEAATYGVLAEASYPRLLDVDGSAYAAAVRAAGTPVLAPCEGPERLGAGASMLFTSGTTGVPKAVVRTRGDPQLAAAVADGLGFGPHTRYLASGPLYHSGPWTCALMALSHGGVVGLMPSFEPASWLDFARRHRVTATFITPTQLRQLVGAVESGAEPPHRLASMVVSGEPFPSELKRRAVAAFGPCVVDCYGCTELGPLTVMPADQLLTRPESCGLPFPGVEVAAFEEDRPLGPGHLGLLRARTPLAFEGYFDAGPGVLDGHRQAWATVGDVGFVDKDGYVYLVDRVDDLIISGGVNVFPADVESVLLEHPAVRQCAVVGLPDERWGQVVCAAVVAERSLTLSEVREWMRGRIADDKRPRRLVRLPSLPTTATEKTSRREVRRLLARADVSE